MRPPASTRGYRRPQAESRGSRPTKADAGERPLRRGCVCAIFGALTEEIRFAADAPVEGKEFEPPVSVAKSRPLADEGKHLAVERGSLVRVVSSRGTEGSNPTPSTSESMANSLPHPAPTAPVLFVCDPGAFAPYLRDRMTVAVSQRIRAATRSEGCTATHYAVNRRLTLSPLRFGAMRLEQHRDWRIPGIDRHPIVALLFRKTLCGPNT